jgi:hypothetical protein
MHYRNFRSESNPNKGSENSRGGGRIYLKRRLSIILNLLENLKHGKGVITALFVFNLLSTNYLRPCARSEGK